MLIALLAYLGGVLTILSPCILPVLPFVFARSDQPFVRSGLPLLAGMALTFALVATLAAVGGGWAVQANVIGRWLALGLLALFGLALIFPALSDRMTRPLVAWGSRLTETTGNKRGIGSSLLLGVATGLLWAPCAGPILGIIFTTAALQGASTNTTLLLLAYALGAATSLAIALLAGGKIFARMKKSMGAGETIKKVLGVAVLVGVAAIAAGLDTRVLANLSTAQTAGVESSLARLLGVSDKVQSTELETRNGMLVLPVEGQLPPLDGTGPWINSPPLTREQLKGKVVIIDFWTYSCINCIRSIPYVRAWYDRYKDDGLVVIGVHAPEFAFERDLANVQKAVTDLGIRYPVALDNKYALWRAMENNHWPAHYFIDAQGRVRYHHFGEGKYEESERVIRQLLTEAGRPPSPRMAGAEAARPDEIGADFSRIRSPETYLGYGRADRFTSGPFANNQPRDYALAPHFKLNDWGLSGRWRVERQAATSLSPGASIAMRFSARDLHLVLGPGAAGKPVRFRVTIDGKPPGRDAGSDIDANGMGVVREERLYQLIRHKGAIGERNFRIEFLDPGVQAFAFTFG
ncbi:cytochrome c biogenesis protein DipZ [Sphingomonas sabuli]|uniref:Cytochrome c biogenesis protein DipZ n=1 Tax=Sphingomonas sabuli TaxID=2764186 RepID=A0A7G9L4F5_9SPHN|nr:cytochrome c biogenesis protein DipZ [Sphingomonas sabuli]QNM83504.1 cytochrome c biogenesis protein DipZ [Sphingomonas sabuli]